MSMTTLLVIFIMDGHARTLSSTLRGSQRRLSASVAHIFHCPSSHHTEASLLQMSAPLNEASAGRGEMAHKPLSGRSHRIPSGTE